MERAGRFETDFDEEPLRQDPRRFDAQKVPRISVAVAKGGVYKTTTVMNLAYAMANDYKCKVLVFDLDAQGNLSKYFTRSMYLDNLKEYINLPTADERRAVRNEVLKKVNVTDEASVMNILDGRAAEPLEKYQVGCVGWTQDWTDEFEETPEVIERFYNGIMATIDQYRPDVVFFDTPPVDSLEGRFCLNNATHFFSTFSASYDAFNGVADAFRIVDWLHSDRGYELKKCCAVIPSGQIKNTHFCHALIQTAVDDYGLLVTDEIPFSVVHPECDFQGYPLVEWCNRKIKETGVQKDIKKWERLISTMKKISSQFYDRLVNPHVCNELTAEAIARIKDNFIYETMGGNT